MTTAALPPARTLRDVTRNCDEDQPLSSRDPRWQDLAPVRGDEALRALERELAWRADGQFVHTMLISHRGAGKSTELLRLAERLDAMYSCLYFESTLELDPRRIDVEELLIALVLTVEAHVRDRGRPLPRELLERVVRWFDEVAKTTKWAQHYSAEVAAGLEMKAEVPFVGSLFGALKSLFRQESEYRTEIKQVLRKYPSALLDSANAVLEAAEKALETQALLIVVDNLDRYPPDVIEALLVSGADRIRDLRANVIFTPPVSLMLKPKLGQLDALYSCHLLYTVQLRRRDQSYRVFEGPGRDALEAMLAKRVDLDEMIPKRETRDRLIAASGGAVRDLLELVSQAAFLARGDRLDLADVEEAIARRKQRMRDLIQINGWAPTLRRLAETKQLFEDEACMLVLFHRLALKYNGDGWYDVHPLVAEVLDLEPPRIS